MAAPTAQPRSQVVTRPETRSHHDGSVESGISRCLGGLDVRWRSRGAHSSSAGECRCGVCEVRRSSESVLAVVAVLLASTLGAEPATASGVGTASVTPALSIAVEGTRLVDRIGSHSHSTRSRHLRYGVQLSQRWCLQRAYRCRRRRSDGGLAYQRRPDPTKRRLLARINGVGGATYRAAITDYVNMLNSFGLYAVLDLHWSAPGNTESTGAQPMPDADHAPAFWESVASTFISNHAVLFDLFNEPHDVSWSVWLNGGIVSGSQAVGMQQLIDAVRSTGATQPVLAEGLLVDGVDPGGVLGTDWLTYAPTHPDGQLVASVHVYDQGSESEYADNIGPVSKSFPVIVGELGETDCADEDIDAFMPWADQAGVSYIAWAWYVGSCSSYPSLVTNYDGAPTPYGAGYMSHLVDNFPAPEPPGTPIAPPGTISTGSGDNPVGLQAGGSSPNATSVSVMNVPGSAPLDPSDGIRRRDGSHRATEAACNTHGPEGWCEEDRCRLLPPIAVSDLYDFGHAARRSG